jgi:IS5 family transposase
MLRLEGLQAECLFDQVLPGEVRELPEDLARLDELLADPALLAPIEAHWRAEAKKSGRSARAHGRPTIPMATYVRLMVIKQRTDWGYETLVKEVSDSLHLRRFCLIGITDRTPDESTVRKLTRRLGSETVAELTRAVIAKAVRERRFRARAARIDSTVVEADVRYPSDAMLCLQGAAALARQGRRLAARIGERANSVRNRSRAVGRRVRQISRTLARRTGEARQQVIALNAETGLLLRRSAKEARRLAALARSKARGRGAQAKLRAASAIEELAERWSASPSKPPSACAARRSPTGSSPSPTPRRGRSARARRASPTSSATWPRSARSRKTPSPAPGASSCRPQAAPATSARTRSCPRLPPSSKPSSCGRERSSSTAASATFAPKSSSPSSNRTAFSSPAARNRARPEPNDDCAATEPGSRAGYPTSSVATGCGDRG